MIDDLERQVPMDMQICPKDSFVWVGVILVVFQLSHRMTATGQRNHTETLAKFGDLCLGMKVWKLAIRQPVGFGMARCKDLDSVHSSEPSAKLIVLDWHWLPSHAKPQLNAAIAVKVKPGKSFFCVLVPCIYGRSPHSAAKSQKSLSVPHEIPFSKKIRLFTYFSVNYSVLP